MRVRCLQCRLEQPNPTPARHPSAFIWDQFRVTVCVRCGHEWSEYV